MPDAPLSERLDGRPYVMVASQGVAFAATRYEEVPADPRTRDCDTLAVAWRGPGDAWAVVDRDGMVYSKTGRPRHEPSPSNRTDAFKRRYRFPFVQALVVASKAANARDRRAAKLREAADA